MNVPAPSSGALFRRLVATVYGIALTVPFLFVCLAPLGAAEEEDPVAAALRRDHSAILSKVKQSDVPVMVAITAKGATFEPLADPRVTARMRWFLPLNIQATTKLAKALNGTDSTAVAFLNAEGEVLARIGPQDSADALLKSMKELSKKARADFIAKLSAEDTTEAMSKTSVEGLIRMGGSGAELLPLLLHKSAAVKTAVTKALPTLPPDEVALAALNGLASEDADMRAACFRWAPAVKTPKTPPVKFWKEAAEDDRKEALAKWREAALIDMGPLNADIMEFLEANLGKQVSNGECSMMVDAAYKVVGVKPMVNKGETYVWGREVTSGQKVLPGDVIQMENCKFAKGVSITHHTQVIRKVLAPGKYEVLEQNVSGRKTVGPGQIDANQLTEGSLKIYRPQPK